jgi:hypothetical protein
VLHGILERWRARQNAKTEREYGHATLAERHELGHLENNAERHMDEDVDAAEGRPGEDDVPRDNL